MKTAFAKAVALILSGSGQLGDIIGVTLRMSVMSSLAALLLGVPLGVFFAYTHFRGKKALIILNRTLMGLPPVVCGLVCYLLFSGVGPLRHWHMLFTVGGMVIAQIILITPIVVGSMETCAARLVPAIRETGEGLGLSRMRLFLLTVGECRYQIISTYLLGFSRAIAEVGAVSMVGGAIAYKTNVMTTAIMNFTNMGNFTEALALGIILLGISLIVNLAFSLLQAGVTK